MSIHVSVQLPRADALVAAEVAGDVLGSVPGQDDVGHLVRRDQSLGTRMMDSVGSPQMGLKMTGQLGIGREGFLAKFALELFHVNKFDVIS